MAFSGEWPNSDCGEEVCPLSTICPRWPIIVCKQMWVAIGPLRMANECYYSITRDRYLGVEVEVQSSVTPTACVPHKVTETAITRKVESRALDEIFTISKRYVLAISGPQSNADFQELKFFGRPKLASKNPNLRFSRFWSIHAHNRYSVHWLYHSEQSLTNRLHTTSDASLLSKRVYMSSMTACHSS